MSFADGVRPQVVLLFGPPGAGKGTIGSMICAAGNHYHLSSGQIFRCLSPESDSGKLFHDYSSRGELVPDEITISIWKRYTQGLIDTNRFFPGQQLLLLDGIPRTSGQVDLIAESVDVLHIIALQVQDPDILQRRIARRAKIEKRLDDADPEVFRKRFEEYSAKTLKVVGRYPAETIKYYSAQQTPIEVLRDVLVGSAHILKAMPDVMPTSGAQTLERPAIHTDSS